MKKFVGKLFLAMSLLCATALGQGAGPIHYISAASTNSTSLVASASLVYSIQLANTNAAARFLKLYDSATAPTCGTTPKKTVIVPGSTAGAGNNVMFPIGLRFNKGVAFCITGAMADADTTAISANEVTADFDVK